MRKIAIDRININNKINGIIFSIIYLILRINDILVYFTSAPPSIIKFAKGYFNSQLITS